MVIFSQNLHITDESSNIIHYNTLIMQFLVINTLIEIHIIIQNKKMAETSFIYKLINNLIYIY